jgi:3-oxo-5-alpha-steroid 4-dehydrogenase 1
MSDISFRYVVIAWIIIAVLVFISLFFMAAPYGRHFRRSFGPSVNGRYGWIAMESPALLVFAAFFITDTEIITLVPAIFLSMWMVHYIDRAFIYPIKLRIFSKPLPLVVLIAGVGFNVMNAYLNSEYILVNYVKYSEAWLHDIRFMAGLALFALGFIINRHSDYILYRIKSKSRQEYGIPQGGLYRWVSCPNYLGEITIWLGWSISTWSPVAATFLLWTIANLVPRARSHHQWYQKHFVDYPSERHVIIPWIW